MLNEQENKYDGSDDSEYHFSDDEVGYETEADAAKPVVVAPEKNPLANLTQSKRMLISLGVFLGLVFVVYKMVSPSTTAPSTDITPATTTAPMTTQAPSMPAPTPAAPVAPAATMPAVMAAPQPTMNAAPTEAAAPVEQPAPAPAEATPGVQQASMTAPPSMGDVVNQMATAAGQAAAAMPPALIAAQTAAQTPVTNTPLANSLDNRAAQVSATNEQLLAQLQADYAQRLADYQAQNKALQDQVQTLNNRVAGMETEMSQLVQTLTKAFQNNGGDATTADASAPDSAAAPVAGPDIKLPYSVQAIIPGRAWLRADNGDTLTVTEGDVIKDVGQVSKIDPYNGIVEIKVGNKTVTLSYGNNG